MCRRIVSLLLVLLFCSEIQAQEPVKIAALIQKIKAENHPDTLQYYYGKLGNAYYKEGNFTKAQESYFEVLRYSEKTNNKHGISTACNNIAAIFNEMDKAKEAIPFARRAIKEAPDNEDPSSLSGLYNTLGQSHYILYEYPEAIKCFETGVSILLPSKDSLEAGVIYKNIGAVYLESGNPQKAVGYFKLGLDYRIRQKDTAMIFTGCCGIAEFYNAIEKYDSAAIYLAQCTALLNAVSKAPHRLRDYYYALYYMYAHTGRLKEAIADLEKYHQLKDSLLNEDNQALVNEEKNKYLLEKKEQEVAYHKQAAESEKNSRIMLLLLLALVIISLGSLIFWLRVKQREKLARLQLKQQQAERDMMIEGQESERRRIARELHDGIVQDLTAIAINLQGKGEVNKEMLAEKVTQAAREARNIAHQMMPVSLMQLGLIKALEDLFQQSYAPLGIGYEFEHFTEAHALSDAVSISLYRICQELVANSVKHSGATLVHVLLRQTEAQIMLVFEDNGSGFDISLSKTGIGMVSINSRVSYLNGEISFDTANGSGTVAIIKIPLVR